MSCIHDNVTVRANNVKRDPSIPPPLPRIRRGGSVIELIYKELHRLSLRVGGHRVDVSTIKADDGWSACGWVEGLDEDGTYQPYIWIATKARGTKEEAQGELLGRLLEVLP
jgi:hypothetical protein